MRRILPLLILVTLITTSSIHAQFRKGMRMAGMNIGSVFSNTQKSEYTYTFNTNIFSADFTPGFGWFVSDKVVVGGRVLFSFGQDRYIDKEGNVTFRKKTNTVSRFGFGIFARNYFINDGTFKPFAQLNLDAGSQRTNTEGFHYTDTYKEGYKGESSNDFFKAAGLSVGVTGMFTKKIGVDITVGYTYSGTKNKFTTNTWRDVDFDGIPDETRKDENAVKTRTHGIAIGAGVQLFF